MGVRYKTMDIGAGILIAKEAGCVVSDFNGQNADMYTDNILLTNEALHSEMVKEIKDHLN